VGKKRGAIEIPLSKREFALGVLQQKKKKNGKETPINHFTRVKMVQKAEIAQKLPSQFKEKKKKNKKRNWKEALFEGAAVIRAKST